MGHVALVLQKRLGQLGHRDTWDRWDTRDIESLLNLMIMAVSSIRRLRPVTICNKKYYKLLQILNFEHKIEPFCDPNSHIYRIYVSYWLKFAERL